MQTVSLAAILAALAGTIAFSTGVCPQAPVSKPQVSTYVLLEPVLGETRHRCHDQEGLKAEVRHDSDEERLVSCL